MENAEPHPAHGIPSSLQLRYYAVGVFDILGQGDVIESVLGLVLSAPDAQARCDSLLRHPIQVRAKFRESFAAIEGWLEDALNQNCPSEAQRAIFRQQMALNYTLQSFSDTVVVVSPLADDNGRFRVFALMWFLRACGLALQKCIEQHIMMRGGIDCDLGVSLNNAAAGQMGDFYGPAFLHAHHIESRQAAWPRVVVSPRVVEYIEQVPTQSLPFGQALVVSAMKAMCIQSQDGLHMLDIFGPVILPRRTPMPPDVVQSIRSLARFIEGEYARFRREGNYKLADRYDRLHTYASGALRDII